MRKTLWSLIIAGGAMTAGCNQVGSPALEKKGRWENGFTLIDAKTVKLVQEDKITHDINQGYNAKDLGMQQTAFYYNLSDSSVVINRGGNESSTQSVGNPILYNDMEKSVKENFSKAVEYAGSFPKLKNQN